MALPSALLRSWACVKSTPSVGGCALVAQSVGPAVWGRHGCRRLEDHTMQASLGAVTGHPLRLRRCVIDSLARAELGGYTSVVVAVGIVVIF